MLGKLWNAGMTSPYYQYALELSGGRPYLYIGTASGLAGAVMDSALALNQWSHVAVVFNGTQAQFYVNGTSTGTKPLTATITARGQLMQSAPMAPPGSSTRRPRQPTDLQPHHDRPGDPERHEHRDRSVSQCSAGRRAVDRASHGQNRPRRVEMCVGPSTV